MWTFPFAAHWNPRLQGFNSSESLALWNTTEEAASPFFWDSERGDEPSTVTQLVDGRLGTGTRRIFIGTTDAEAPSFWPPDAKCQLIGKDSDAGEDWRQERGVRGQDSITKSMDRNLSKFWETVEERGAWCCSPWGANGRTQLSDWTAAKPRWICVPPLVCSPPAFSRSVNNTVSQGRRWRVSRGCLAQIPLRNDRPLWLLGKSQPDINFTTVNGLHNIFV